MLKRILFMALLCGFALAAAPSAMAKIDEFHQTTEGSEIRVDHSGWDDILGKYLSYTEDNISLFNYAAVTDTDKQALKGYIESLAQVDPTALDRNEAFAYWANLYNAVTIDIVLDNYPVGSILRIRSGLRPGPWKRKLVTVNGQALSLDNIEHDIMRPYFRDPRVHYAVNCASIGCPNLAEKAFTGDTLEQMLEAGARAYINHPRGVTIEDGRVTASSIYKWFQEDFGDTEAGVIEHMKPYAEPGLKAQLESVSSINRFKYDWALNRPTPDDN